jgi:hypothetical protein
MPRWTRYETFSGKRPRDRLLEQWGEYPEEEGQYDIHKYYYGQHTSRNIQPQLCSVLVIGQRQYSSYQQYAHPEATHKGSQGYQGHPKEESTAPYEESIHNKKTTKEKINSRPPPAALGDLLDQTMPHTPHMMHYKDT